MRLRGAGREHDTCEKVGIYDLIFSKQIQLSQNHGVLDSILLFKHLCHVPGASLFALAHGWKRQQEPRLTLDNRCCLTTVALAWTGDSLSLSLSSFSSSSLPVVLSSAADEAGAGAVDSSLRRSRAADSSTDNGDDGGGDDDDEAERAQPNREWSAP